MRGRHWITALLVLIVVALGVVVLLDDGAGESRLVPPVADAPVEEADDRPDARPGRVERTQTTPDEAEDETDAEDAYQPPLPGLLEVTVTVVAAESGAALPGARVVAAASDLDWRREGTTDDGGQVTFDGAPPQDFLQFTAFADGRVRLERSEPAGDAELRLHRGRMIEGRVVRARDGSPVAGATVTLTEGGSIDGMSSMSSAGPLGETVTDASGRFRIGAAEPSDIVTVTARADELVTRGVSLLVPEVDAPADPVEVRLPPAGRVVGRVLGVDGEPPPAGSLVYGAPEDERWLLESPGMTSTGPDGIVEALLTTTDADGRFELGGVPLERPFAVVAVDHLRRHSAIVGDLLATEANPVARAELRIQARAKLLIRLVAPRGESLEDAEVRLGGVGWPRTAEALGDGRFRFRPAPPGDYRLYVVVPGFVRVERDVALSSGDDREVEVVLERGHELAGTVVDDLGEPVEDFSIRITRPYGPEYRDLPPSESGAATDEQGRFVVRGLLSGPHRLSAYGAGHGSIQIDVFDVPGTPLELVAPREGEFRGRFVVPDGGAAPTRINVHVSGPDGGGSGSGGDYDPDVEVTDLPVGEVTVRVLADGYARWERTFDVAPGATIDVGEVTLEPGVELRGRVLAPDGSPVVRARVEYGETFTPEHQVEVTDEAGAFRLRHLPARPVEVEIRADGYLPAHPSLDPTGAAAHEVRLVRGALLRGRLLGPDGEPLADGWMNAERVDGDEDKEGFAHADGAGRYEVRLHAGEYRIEWGDDDHSRALPDVVVVTDAETLELDLR